MKILIKRKEGLAAQVKVLGHNRKHPRLQQMKKKCAMIAVVIVARNAVIAFVHIE